MSFISQIKEKAEQDIKTIVLTESEDIRVLKAASKVMEEGFANIILIGDDTEVKQVAEENNINMDGIKIINPKLSNKYEEYVNSFYELRKAKGMTLEKAKETLLDPIYFGMMMVKQGDSDG